MKKLKVGDYCYVNSVFLSFLRDNKTIVKINKIDESLSHPYECVWNDGKSSANFPAEQLAVVPSCQTFLKKFKLNNQKEINALYSCGLIDIENFQFELIAKKGQQIVLNVKNTRDSSYVEKLQWSIPNQTFSTMLNTIYTDDGYYAALKSKALEEMYKQYKVALKK